MFRVITSHSLEDVSKSISEYMDNLRSVKAYDKIFISKNKKIYIDGFGVFRPISRALLGRDRYNTMKDLEKIFQKYFNLIDNIFAYEQENNALLNFHLLLIEDYIQGLGNLKFTYENSKPFEKRADILLLKLFSIKKDIYQGKYLDNQRRRIYSA